MAHHFGLTALAAAGVLAAFASPAQTPEQAATWQADRERQLAEQKARNERQMHEREARKADPMAWVRTLDPMTAGGWQFRAVANDGSWATFSTDHQLKRAGKLVTIWLREEFAEPQSGADGAYSSMVQKVQYDCAKDQVRSLLVVYYGQNNFQGSERSEEAEVKESKIPWTSIVPGTRDEFSFAWACDGGKPSAR